MSVCFSLGAQTSCAKCDGENITITDPSCSGGSGAGFTVEIQGPDLSTATNPSFPFVEVAQNGDYIVRCIDNGVCGLDSTIISVTVNSTPVANAGPDVMECDTGSTALDGTGSTGASLTYAWTTPDGNIVSGASTATPTVDANGAYILIVTSGGCNSDPDTTNVMIYPPITQSPTCS